MQKSKINKEELIKFRKELGIDLFGVADIRLARKEFLLKPELREKFDFAVSLGRGLIHSVLEDLTDRPTPLYFHHYRQLNFFLDRAALLLSSFIQERGYRAIPIPASQVIDWEAQRGHLSHKKIGQLAGLGWIGRNNLLVNPMLGARFRLVSILTDMPLEPDEPTDSGCGACVACLTCCPVNAIKLDREKFDHRACFEKLKEFRRSGIVGQHICGLCVKACGPRQELRPGSP